MIRLGIVGCGLTGAATAMLLKQRLPQLNVMILEKSRGTGGRMSTSRNSKGNSVDLGAQFITKTKNLTSIQESCYTELIKEGLLAPLLQTIDGIRSTSSTIGHFVCSKGSGSIVKHFLQKSGCKILFGQRVVKVNSSNQKWLMECDDGSSYEFDAVVLTMPIPQILQLGGLSNVLQDHYKKLEAVEFCSRFALGLYYDTDVDVLTSIPHSAKFISDDPVIRYYSIDHQKRGVAAPLSIAVHTTKEFGKMHVDEDFSLVQPLIMENLKRLIPELPTPAEIKSHKWRFSQVENSFKGDGSLTISTSPLFICGGDGFTYSTFEGCILSAERIVSNIADSIK